MPHAKTRLIAGKPSIFLSGFIYDVEVPTRFHSLLEETNSTKG
jgi:hypothetical protein